MAEPIRCSAPNGQGISSNSMKWQVGCGGHFIEFDEMPRPLGAEHRIRNGPYLAVVEAIKFEKRPSLEILVNRIFGENAPDQKNSQPPKLPQGRIANAPKRRLISALMSISVGI